MPTTSKMTLPSKEEYLTSLQEQQSTHATEESCPICQDAQPDVLTPCQHPHCLECLSIWLDNSNTCPMCRGELYEADNDLNNDVLDDGDLDDQDIDDDFFVYESIDRLDLNFDVDEDEVTAAVVSLRHQDLERTIARSQPIYVNHDALVARSVAGVLYLNPEVEEGFTLDELDRSMWSHVLDIIQHTISRLENQTLTCGELWDALDNDIHVTFEGMTTMKYADDSEGEHGFQHDLFDLLNYIAYQAHRCYLTQYHGHHTVHPLQQLPGHFTPLGHPPLLHAFETSEADIADNLAHIAEQDLSNLNLHNLEDHLLYLSFAQLYPAMLGAIYSIKPNLPPNPENPSTWRHDLLYNAWQGLVHDISDTLFDLHGRKTSAEQFWQRLDKCTTEHRGLTYRCRRDGETSFDDDITRVLRSVVLSALRFNDVKLLPVLATDSGLPETGHSE